MSLAFESNTDLAYNTLDFSQQAKKYEEIADELETMADDLVMQLDLLKSKGWTTPAGSSFQKMADMNWRTNIKKYSGLLRLLAQILRQASSEYDQLTINYIEKTTLNLPAGSGRHA